MTPTQTALLVLEDGSVFRGSSIGSDGASVGEVVFNTAMSGYQEIITDPSYAQQIVTFTYPHIGNVGVNDEDPESGRAYLAGIVLREVPRRPSSWRARQDLRESLREQGIVGIAGVDTRRLTRLLRDKGAQNGCVMVGGTVREALSRARAFPGLKDMDLAKVVSCREPYAWTQGRWPEHALSRADGLHVVVYDYGVKLNILRMLVDRGCRVTVVPAQASVESVRALAPDGVLLSNGPGDPAPCTYAIEAARAHMRDGLPLFGICLGHQILGIAVGGTTQKMKFGHHGANHPVLDLASGRVMITSQNHGFSVDERSLPDTVEVTHRSLFDSSNQGIRVKDAPAFGFQGHPEASPGPHDVGLLFDRFVRMTQEARR